MNDKVKISDEMLNAFVDGQLTTEEKEQLYVSLTKDDDLKKTICELRSCKDLVQLAYQQPPASPGGFNDNNGSSASGSRHWATGIAASILLAVGAVIGWQFGSVTSNDLIYSASNAHTATSVKAMADDNSTKVLFHLNSRDPEKVREALEELEGVLKFYKRTGQNARIEMITNGGGIDLLRSDTSPYPDRVLALQEQYPNLTFVTCQNTIDRLKEERGVTAQLLPGTVVIDSGVAQIMRRQREGWAYIQV
jgi:intracellular sulfur oxidation DsrE/DsrF family protein